MRLLIIRHAIAAPATGRLRDENRPLTPEGERSFRDTARLLARVAHKPAAILTSPMLRARQTADIAARAWGNIEPTIAPALAGGDWPALRRTLAGYHAGDTVALVGHENWISTLTARLLGSRRGGAFDYRKGGASLIEVEDLDACKGALLWFIPPRIFRRIG